MKKLEWPRIHEIRTFYHRREMSVKEMAQILNVSKSCIYAVINQKTWQCPY